jgi:hypothetical protein
LVSGASLGDRWAAGENEAPSATLNNEAHTSPRILKSIILELPGDSFGAAIVAPGALFDIFNIQSDR